MRHHIGSREASGRETGKVMQLPSTERLSSEREGWLHGPAPQAVPQGPPAVWCYAVAILKSLIIFEQGAPHLGFVSGSIDYVASSDERHCT